MPDALKNCSMRNVRPRTQFAGGLSFIWHLMRYNTSLNLAVVYGQQLHKPACNAGGVLIAAQRYLL